MKYLLNALLLLSFLTICPADTNKKTFEYKIIQQQYTPNFATRHPCLTQITAALCVGSLAVTCTHYAQEKENSSIAPILIGVSAALCTSAFTNCQQHLLDTLLINPAHALEGIYAAEKFFKEDIIASHPTIESLDSDKQCALFKEYIKKHTTSFPILFLGECTQYDRFGKCVFSRAYNKKYRKTFETVVSSACLEKIGAANNPITYTSFGCGGAFQDLVILTKVLTQKPNAQLTVNLIDGQHTIYTKSKELLKEQRIIDADKRTDLTPALPIMIQIALAESKSNQQINEFTIQNNLVMSVAHIEEKYAQMLSFLKTSFPNASLTLYLHDTQESYEQYRQENKLENPDVLNASDIQDEMSILRSGPLHYATLCVQTLAQKPTAFNAWLAKKENNQKTTVSICTISLNKKNEADEIFDIKIQEKPIQTYLQIIHKL